MYAVSMARNLEILVENKQVINYKINNWCPATAKDIQSSYMKLMDVCISSKSFVDQAFN